MMNDGFSVQLRRHLLESADERPAEGQLAAIAERVAVTAQRRPIVARLTWFPARIGPVPTRALRYGLLVAALLALTAGAAILAGALINHPSTIFEGTWSSIDPADSSTMTLTVGPGNAPPVHFEDHFASGAACTTDTIKLFKADGTGVITANRLEVTWPDGGGCGSRTVSIGPGTYTYDGATDTIVDGQQLVWQRVQGGPALPTRDLLTATSPPAPPQVGACRDIPAGAAYSHAVGALALTVTMPAAPGFEWKGSRDGFAVMGSCFFGGPISIDASIVTTVVASCDTDGWVNVATPSQAVAALASAPGIAMSEPTTVTLGGHPASRFEIAPNARMCFEEVRLWNDDAAQRGSTTIIYLVDVDGLPLGIRVNADHRAPPAQLAEAEALLASLQIGTVPGPRPSMAPALTPDPNCVQFKGTGTYTARVGPLSVSATLPNEPDTYWHGDRDAFSLSRSPCLFDAPLIEGSLVTEIAADACHWDRPGIEVADAAAAAVALRAQAVSEVIGQAELTIAGYHAIRVDLAVSPDIDTSDCSGGGQVGLWAISDGEAIRIEPGSPMTVYLVDVDGRILALREPHGRDAEAELPTLRADADANIGSLQIQP